MVVLKLKLKFRSQKLREENFVLVKVSLPSRNDKAVFL